MDAAVLKKVALFEGLTQGPLSKRAQIAPSRDKDLAYVLLWTFVRTLSERLRGTNDTSKAFFPISRF